MKTMMKALTILATLATAGSAFAEKKELNVICTQKDAQPGIDVVGISIYMTLDTEAKTIDLIHYTPRNDRIDYNGRYDELKFSRGSELLTTMVAGPYYISLDNSGAVTEIHLLGSYTASNPAFNYAGQYKECAPVPAS